MKPRDLDDRLLFGLFGAILLWMAWNLATAG
jgi:RsiW-degrading membrane proteinase PrsW (M82 family)